MIIKKIATWIEKNVRLLTILSVFSLATYALLASIGSGVIDSRLFFNSDAIYLPVLYKDIFEDKFLYSGWMMPEATYFFPDGLIYLLTRLLLNNFVIATYLYSVFIFILLFISFSVLYRALFPNSNPRSFLCFNLLTGISILLISHGKIFLLTAFLITPNIHQGTYLMMVVAAILTFIIIRDISQAKKRDYVVLFSALTLAIISDRTYLFHLVLPITLTVFSFLLLTNSLKTFMKPSLKYGLITVSAVATGLLTYQKIVPFPSPIEPVKNSRSVYFLARDLKRLLTQSELKINVATIDYKFHNDTNFLVIALMLFLIISVFITINFIIKRRNKQQINKNHLGLIFLSLFVPFIIVSDIGSVIFSGRYTDLIHLRYITPSLLFPLIGLMMIFSQFIFVNLSEHLKRRGRSLVLFLIIGTFFLLMIKAPKGNLKALNDYYPNLIRCLDENSEKYGLKYGVADYWDANLNTMLSKKGLRIYQVTTTEGYIDAFHLINNADWYIGDEHTNYKNPAYNFVILKYLNREAVIKTLGVPESKFLCDDNEIYVYNLKDKNDILLNRFRARFAFRKLTNPGDILNFPASTFNSSVIFSPNQSQGTVGQITGDFIKATKESSAPRPLSEGPAVLLKKGLYEINLTYETGLLNAAEAAGNLIIQTSSNPIASTAPLRSITTGDNSIIGQLKLGDETVPGVPYKAKIVLFKVSFNGKADLIVKNLAIKRID